VSVLDTLVVVSLLATVLAAPFSMVAWSNYSGSRPEQRVFPRKSFLFFTVPLLIGVLAGGISTAIAQHRVRTFLASVSAQATVEVDGRAAPDSSKILDALRQVRDLPPHHSSPTRMFDVTISDPPRELSLWVARDSREPKEFWVFYPSSSKLALKSEVGRVRTTVFDGLIGF